MAVNDPFLICLLPLFQNEASKNVSTRKQFLNMLKRIELKFEGNGYWNCELVCCITLGMILSLKK